MLEEGREKDWFNDTLIIRLSIVAGVSLAGMLWWELSPRNKHPVIDFHVLKNRDLAGSIFLFIALGFGLYGGVFLFPLFTQNLLHFTPTETGLTLMPGGIATAVAAIMCGRALSGARPLVDARILIYIGMSLFVVAMWRLGHLTVDAGEPEARYALIIRGLGLGFLFTPINNVAYANLKPSQAQQASGLINLSRQLGGSFGIAIITTFLDHQVAHAPGDADREHVYREPAARRASERGGRRAHREGLQRHPGEAGCVGDPRRVRDAAGDDAQLQRRLDVDPGDLRSGGPGGPDSEEAQEPRAGAGGALERGGRWTGGQVDQVQHLPLPTRTTNR